MTTWRSAAVGTQQLEPPHEDLPCNQRHSRSEALGDPERRHGLAPWRPRSGGVTTGHRGDHGWVRRGGEHCDRAAAAPRQQLPAAVAMRLCTGLSSVGLDAASMCCDMSKAQQSAGTCVVDVVVDVAVEVEVVVEVG